MIPFDKSSGVRPKSRKKVLLGISMDGLSLFQRAFAVQMMGATAVEYIGPVSETIRHKLEFHDALFTKQ